MNDPAWTRAARRDLTAGQRLRRHNPPPYQSTLPVLSNMSQASSRNWFREAFRAEYRDVYAGRTQEDAERAVKAVVAALPLTAHDIVLDLCCGHGRHLRALARLGIPSVGVDLSADLLRLASAELRGKKPHATAATSPRLVRGDMRRLPFAASFTAVVNFFTSFGYFETDRENERAAAEIARVLRLGGRFCLDLMNPTRTLKELKPHTQRTAGRLEIVETRRFDQQHKRIEKRVELSHPDWPEPRGYVESVRLFTADEIERLLAAQGLNVERVVGDFNGSPFDGGSERMIVLGSKTAPPPASGAKRGTLARREEW